MSGVVHESFTTTFPLRNLQVVQSSLRLRVLRICASYMCRGRVERDRGWSGHACVCPAARDARIFERGMQDRRFSGMRSITCVARTNGAPSHQVGAKRTAGFCSDNLLAETDAPPVPRPQLHGRSVGLGTSYWAEQRPAGSMLEDHALEPFEAVLAAVDHSHWYWSPNTFNTPGKSPLRLRVLRICARKLQISN